MSMQKREKEISKYKNAQNKEKRERYAHTDMRERKERTHVSIKREKISDRLKFDRGPKQVLLG